MSMHPSESRLGKIIEQNVAKELTPAEEAEFRTLLAQFDTEGPNPSNFVDLYGQEQVEIDKANIAQRLQDFSKKDARTIELAKLRFYAKVLELIMAEFSSSWIAGYFSKASQYDDFNSRTDLFFETETESGTIARTSIDVVSGGRSAQEKIEQIKEKLISGMVGQEVKYFESQLDDARGRYRLPQLVIGTDINHISELGRLYLKYKKSEPNYKKAIKERIDNHPFGKELVDELLVQLRSFIEIVRLRRITPLAPGDQEIIEHIRLLEKTISDFNSGEQKISTSDQATGGENRVLRSIVSALAL